MRRRQAEQWEEEIRRLLEIWGHWQRSLPSAIGGSVIGSYSERIEPGIVTPAENETAEAMERVLCQVKRASHNAYRVLHWYYVHEASTRDIAEHMDRSHARVRELKLIGETMAAATWYATFSAEDYIHPAA